MVFVSEKKGVLDQDLIHRLAACSLPPSVDGNKGTMLH